MTEIRLLPIIAAEYQRHSMHAAERVWTETNCYIDVWVEVLHALDLDPVAANACAISADFEGDQWTFLKYRAEELWDLYGIDVHEMNPWRSLPDHIEDHLASGRFLTMEADSYYLPDTSGVSYRLAHTKSTIVPNMIDRSRRRLGYFHNAGYFELDGDDFDGVLKLSDAADSVLPPYVETVRLDRLTRLGAADLAARSALLARKHLELRPSENPVARLADRLLADASWLGDSDIETFHAYAFATLRQCGLTAELASDYCDWLTRLGIADVALAGKSFALVAEKAKSVQFRMARLVRGRRVEIAGSLEDMTEAWDRAMREFADGHVC